MIKFVELPKNDPQETRESKLLTAKGRLQWRLMVLGVVSVATAVSWYRGVGGARNMTSVFMALMGTLLFAIVSAAYLMLSIVSSLHLISLRKRQDDGPDWPRQELAD
jgi:hypothetical protein